MKLEAGTALKIQVCVCWLGFYCWLFQKWVKFFCQIQKYWLEWVTLPYLFLSVTDFCLCTWPGALLATCAYFYYILKTSSLYNRICWHCAVQMSLVMFFCLYIAWLYCVWQMCIMDSFQRPCVSTFRLRSGSYSVRRSMVLSGVSQCAPGWFKVNWRIRTNDTEFPFTLSEQDLYSNMYIFFSPTSNRSGVSEQWLARKPMWLNDFDSLPFSKLLQNTKSIFLDVFSFTLYFSICGILLYFHKILR